MHTSSVTVAWQNKCLKKLHGFEIIKKHNLHESGYGKNTTVIRGGYLDNKIVAIASRQKTIMHPQTNLFFLLFYWV